MYAGVWTQTAGTISVLAGDQLYFTGAGDTFAGTLAGAGDIFFRRFRHSRRRKS